MNVVDLFSAGTRRNNNVFTTSTRRRRRRVDVVKTLSLRYYCVMCPLVTQPVLPPQISGPWTWMPKYQHQSLGVIITLQWRHNGRDSVSNHQLHDCLLNRLFRRRSKKTSLAFVRGIHRGPVNSPHKWPVTRKMFPFDDVIMKLRMF